MTVSTRQHVLAWSLLLATAAALAALSWHAWGEPIIDLGREVYVPWQLREGRTLYRELLYNYGPIAPYAMAVVTWLCGDTLGVYAASGALIGLATMGGLYASGCRMGSRTAGFVAALLFTLHSFFGYSTWGCNYVLPYAYAATLSMALAVWSFYALLGYVEIRSRRSLVAGAALMTAAALTKQEVGLAIGGTWLVAAWIHRMARRDAGIVAVVAAAPAALALALFSARAGDHALFGENLFRVAGGSRAQSFFLDVAGLDRWRDFGLDLSVYRAALPLALAAIAWAGRRTALWLLAVLTLLSAPRVLFAFDPSWYGFYLYVPAYLLVAYGVGVWLARWRALTVAAIVIAGCVAWRFNHESWLAYRAKTARLETSRGVMRDEPIGRAEAIAAFLDYMNANARRTDTLVVLPEGATLNWWSGLRNPTAYINFIPPEITSPSVERDIVRELASTAPDYVALTSRPLDEFGERDLRYMPEVAAYIGRRYQRIAVFGAPPAWQLALMKRRP